MSEAIDRVIEALDRAGCNPRYHRESDYWQAHSPLREDKKPSLTISQENGKILIFDHQAGKEATPEILKRVGLTMADLFPQDSRAKPITGNPQPISYTFTDETGKVLYQKRRYGHGDKKGFAFYHQNGSGWTTGKGEAPNVPYRLADLLKAGDQWIYLSESEKDADTIARIGAIGTSHPGSAADWDPTLDLYFKNLKVAILAHNDEAGHKWAERVASELHSIAKMVKVITPKLGGWHIWPKGDFTDLVENDKHKPAEALKILENITHNAPIWTPEISQADLPESEPIFKALSLAELLRLPKKEWYITGLIGKGDISMIFGESGRGKTNITIDLMIAASLGRRFADKFDIPNPLKIAYCASEGIAGLPNRFAAAINKYQVSPDSLPLMIYTNVPQFFDEAIETNVYTFVSELSGRSAQLDMLVIDTLHGASTGADENHAKDAGIVLNAARYARDRLNCTILLIHHANKLGSYRGSSALHGAMDTMLQIKMDDGVGIVECFKQKDAERFNPLYFRLVPDTTSESVYVQWLEAETINLNEPTIAEKAKQAILDLLAQESGLNQSRIIDSLDFGRHSVREALFSLVKSGEVIEDNQGNKKLYQLKLEL